jgi:adrenodoxin-NADP+ reductase
MTAITHQAPYICFNCSRSLRLFSPKPRNAPGPARRYVSLQQKPFRLAVIGSGPAAFYAASKVMREHADSRVDMYERLPIPFGLVRYGVAPDHPEVKNCQERFEEVASLPNFQFIGNVNVGVDVSLESLKPHYDAILFAYGASKDRELGLPGEHLDGVMSARAFVGWYNGLPEYSHLVPKLERGSEAVVIGQGNVALDVARILLSDVDKLRKTDMPEYALELLSRSKISKVHAVGRRGPMQV